MPNRPHPRNPSRTKLFNYLDRGMTVKDAAKRAGYRRSPQMLCHLRKIWPDPLYPRQKAEKPARVPEEPRQEPPEPRLQPPKPRPAPRPHEKPTTHKPSPTPAP